MEGNYIKFVPGPDKPKTKTWYVHNKDNNTLLGMIGWYNPWRQYSFFPNGTLPLVFEKTCLRDIAKFVEYETVIHNSRIKYAKLYPQVD